MPGPFPGMDPYLESPHRWHGFHDMFVTFLTETLNASLPLGFAADCDQRVYLRPQGRFILPDVGLNARVVEQRTLYHAGAAATMVPPGTPDGEITAYPEEEREGFIEIHSAEDDWERLVAIIEVLSPSNKAANSIGREEYLRKQRAALESDAHLMEIDLLRGGIHTVAAPLDELRDRGHYDSVVSLHRSNRRYVYQYWLGTYRTPLPKVLVPLTEGVPDVVLDLQHCFDRAYDAGPYRRKVDYGRPPSIPLSDEDAAWIDALLRGKGSRP